MAEKKSKKATKPKAKPVSKAEGVISFILDETGSMLSVRDAAISAFNEFVNSLKEKKIKANMTLTRFNSYKGIDIDFSNVPLSKVGELTNYSPEALTPLYDAIGTTLNNLRLKVKDGQKVMVIILTDGLENHSQQYTRQAIFDLITEFQGKGWEFTFMGSNQDAWVASGEIGIPMAHAATFHQNATGYGAVSRTMTVDTCSYFTKGKRVASMTDEYKKQYKKGD